MDSIKRKSGSHDNSNLSLRETEKAKHRLPAEIVFAETKKPVYPEPEDLAERFTEYREALLASDTNRCRQFVKELIASEELTSA